MPRHHGKKFTAPVPIKGRGRSWDYTATMDHHKSTLIECKLKKYTTYVGIDHKNKAGPLNVHTALHMPKLANILCACVPDFIHTDGSMCVKEGIYWPHGGSHINIINLNYIGLFVYQPAQTQFS